MSSIWECYYFSMLPTSAILVPKGTEETLESVAAIGKPEFGGRVVDSRHKAQVLSSRSTHRCVSLVEGKKPAQVHLAFDSSTREFRERSVPDKLCRSLR